MFHYVLYERKEEADAVIALDDVDFNGSKLTTDVSHETCTHCYVIQTSPQRRFDGLLVWYHYFVSAVENLSLKLTAILF